mmetsp:Transcript_45/g.79  ORF Transcript_45/g.79 Transcript_45/m.79 type:complete len:112 (-) Transcript_45:120-455(-)
MMVASKDIVTAEELHKHAKQSDCWVCIHGRVYDMTKFLNDHPGGVEVVLQVAGKDATKDWKDVGHSDYAAGLMREFYVGDLGGTAAELQRKDKVENEVSDFDWDKKPKKDN